MGRWTSGIAYQPYGLPSTGTADPCGMVGDNTKEIGDPLGNVEWEPYWIWAGDTCSAFSADEVEARARTHLDSQTSHLIEQVLFTNTVDGADYGAEHPNVGLSDDDLPTTTVAPAFGSIYLPNNYESFPIVTAFQTMIEALKDSLGGVRGMIHVEKRLLPLIAFNGLAVQNGTRLVTTLGDHIVVPGTGYTGADPAANAPGEFHSWIYGTSMVEVLISPIEVSADLSSALNRDTNKVEYRAERLALAHWDRTAHIGIPVCLEDPQGDCSDSGS